VSAVVSLLIVRLLRTGDLRRWAPAGLVLGVGLLNKSLVGLVTAIVLLALIAIGPRGAGLDRRAAPAAARPRRSPAALLRRRVPRAEPVVDRQRGARRTTCPVSIRCCSRLARWRIAGGADAGAAVAFTGCEIRARIDNREGLHNVEQEALVWVCRGERRPWSRLWGSLRHYD